RAPLDQLLDRRPRAQGGAPGPSARAPAPRGRSRLRARDARARPRGARGALPRRLSARAQRLRKRTQVERRPRRSRSVAPLTTELPREPTIRARTMRGEPPVSSTLIRFRLPEK